MDEWMDRLRVGADGARPTGDAHARVSDELGRRRRRRSVVIAAGAVAGVVLVAGVAAAVPQLGGDEGAPDVSTTPTLSDPAIEPFSCPRESPVHTEDPPTGSQPVGPRALDGILHHARRATRDLDGLAGFAYWGAAGAILVQWKRPVPDEVRRLEDIRFKSGGQIVVRGVTYSAADVRAAQRALDRWLRRSGWRANWSVASACGDFSGLEVGMVPASVSDDYRPTLQREISEAVGMPVHVVVEAKPVALLHSVN